MFECEAYSEDVIAGIDNLSENKDPKTVLAFLSEIGLVSGNANFEKHQFRRYVLIECENDEIYGSEERQIINSIDDVWICPERFLRTQKGRIACRMFYFDLEQRSQYLYAAVALMKIVNKASTCFNMFLFRFPEGFSFGVKKYGNVVTDDCTLSYPPLFTTISEELFWMQPSAYFVDFYLQVVSAIEKKPEVNQPDLEYEILRKRGYQSSYIETIREIGQLLDEEVEVEVSRYISSFKEHTDEAFQDFAESLSSLVLEINFERHESVNTLEMLFDAEEVERLSNEALNRTTVADVSEDDTDEKRIHDFVRECNDSPEELIKRIKKLKGL